MKRLLLALLLFSSPIYAETISKKTLTESEDKALLALCKIGLNASCYTLGSAINVEAH